MGIDIHNLQLLAHAQDLGVAFDRTLAIGRQAIFIEDWELEEHRRLRGLPPLAEPPVEPGRPRYFEPMLRQWFGAQKADAVDASPYEQARLIHDMNLPWPVEGEHGAVRGGYDAVLDFGCLEHVFNFPVAWRNCVDLARVGGHVFHALPANNLSGHGFYQFSPELFFNLYRPENGFELRGLWFALKADRRHWWRGPTRGGEAARQPVQCTTRCTCWCWRESCARTGPLCRRTAQSRLRAGRVGATGRPRRGAAGGCERDAGVPSSAVLVLPGASSTPCAHARERWRVWRAKRARAAWPGLRACPTRSGSSRVCRDESMSAAGPLPKALAPQCAARRFPLSAAGPLPRRSHRSAKHGGFR
jgi:hypothetical protein